MGDFGGLDIIAAYSVENHNAVQAVLVDMKLMQRAALTGYCSALIILAFVRDVMQCSLVHLFLGCAYYLTMHS